MQGARLHTPQSQASLARTLSGSAADGLGNGLGHLLRRKPRSRLTGAPAGKAARLRRERRVSDCFSAIPALSREVARRSGRC